jgi:large subunit ribosomal protein L22
MQVQAITRNVNMSAQKMREVVRQIQGMKAAAAQAVLAVVPRKSARFVAKTLQSAIANAEDQARARKIAHFRSEALWVRSAVAGTASTANRKRFTPKARGSAGPIIKRTCHIKIVLSDE